MCVYDVYVRDVSHALRNQAVAGAGDGVDALLLLVVGLAVDLEATFPRIVPFRFLRVCQEFELVCSLVTFDTLSSLVSSLTFLEVNLVLNLRSA